MKKKTKGKKEHLIKSLKIVISALRNDTILYEWTSPESCNCGIVSQAVLETNSENLASMTSKFVSKLKKIT